MMRSERVTVLMGGPSSEHEVSKASGEQVLRALEGRWPVTRAVIERDGRWVFDGEPSGGGEGFTLGAILDRLKASSDVVFPALHGAFGEDGTVQALLELLEIPYVGSGVLASALAMDKARTKRLYEASGLPTPRFAHLTPADGAQVEDAVRSVFPCVVKPSRSGSSFGVSFPETEEAARQAVAAHLEAGLEVVVEAIVSGRELTCGVLDFEDGPRALPVTEIVPKPRPAASSSSAVLFFDFFAKYTPGASDEITPARIPDALRDQIQALAVRAHRALGCRDLSRTDVMLDGEAPRLLETNTLPGLTETSLLPQAARAAGLDFPALVDHLLRRALSRRPRTERPGSSASEAGGA